jgi:hypothetical protein
LQWSQQPATSCIQSKPHNKFQTNFKSVLILCSHLHLDLPNAFFPSCLPSKYVYTFLIYAVPAACPGHHIQGKITIIIFAEKYNLWNLLCKFLHLLLLPHISPTTLFSNTNQPTFFPQHERPYFTAIQNTWSNDSFVYFKLSFLLTDYTKTKEPELHDSKHPPNLICS